MWNLLPMALGLLQGKKQKEDAKDAEATEALTSINKEGITGTGAEATQAGDLSGEELDGALGASAKHYAGPEKGDTASAAGAQGGSIIDSPYAKIGMMLAAKKQQTSAAKRAEQQGLLDRRARQAGGDTLLSEQAQAHKARRNQNYVGDASTLYGAFASNPKRPGAAADEQLLKDGPDGSFGPGGNDQAALQRAGLWGQDPLDSDEERRRYGLLE
jgi:hypothetical protein